MKQLLIILSILLLSSTLFALSKGSGVLYFRYGNENVGWYEKDDGSKYGKYLGDIKNGKPNGQGKVTWSVGDKYVGEWREGRYHGDGIYNFKNGDKYVGEWKEDKRNGQGTYTFSDGRKYVGEKKDGKPWNVIFFDKDGKIISKYVNGMKQ